MEPRIEYARAEDGASIACTAIGQGPPIVLAGNYSGDLTLFSHAGLPLVDRLVEAGHRVIVYDQRGTGASDRDFGRSTPDTRLSDLESVIDRMVDGPFALIGRIHAGPIAIAYAARHNDRVTHLACFDGYVRGSDYYTATPYTRAIRVMAGIAEDDWEFFTLALANFAGGFRDAEFAAKLAAAFKAGMTPQGYMHSVESAESVDVSALLPLISVPTLAIHDRSAVLSDPRAARSIASSIAGAQSMLVRSPQEAAEAIIEFLAAHPATSAGVTEARVQTGVRTILFTDIVGHTEMMQRLGDAKGRDVLREHERITRDLLKQHGGAEVKTMGDGFMASFGSVTQALDCAIALQRAFAEHTAGTEERRDAPSGPSPSMPEPLHVRVGLNAGEPIEEDGDLFGATVILASRIAAKAGAGEILIPEPVRHLLSGKNYIYTDRGEHAMKGFDDAVRLYEVRWHE